MGSRGGARASRARRAADRDRTAVFVLSDHGELLGERGFVGHSTELYEPAVRALLLARVPGFNRPRVDAPVSLADLAPTFLALAGADPLDDAVDRAISCRSSPAATTRAPVFLYEDARALGLRSRRAAWSTAATSTCATSRRASTSSSISTPDPGETANLRRDLPAVRARLANLLESWSAFVTGG